jgi:tetratricopeptide (TPR) repeat protein
MNTVSSALFSLLLLGQQPAQPPENKSETSETTAAAVERLYAEGAAFFKAGKHQQALDKFQLAYALFPEPNLLFNMARAHEAMGERDQALTRYRLCADDPETAPEIAARARDNVAKLEELKAAELAAAIAAAAAAAPATTQPTPEPATNAAATTVPTLTPAPVPTPWLTPTGITLLAVGTASVVAGGVVYGVGASSHAQIDDAKQNLTDGIAPLTRVEAEALVASGSTNKQVGVALAVVGAVVGVAGGAVWALSALPE